MPDSTPPAWPNLDALVGAPTRAEFHAAAQAEALEPAVQDLAVRSYRALRAFEETLGPHHVPA